MLCTLRVTEALEQRLGRGAHRADSPPPIHFTGIVIPATYFPPVVLNMIKPDREME